MIKRIGNGVSHNRMKLDFSGRRVAPSIFVLCVCVVVWVGATDVPRVYGVQKGSATDAVKSTIDQVLEILADESFKDPARKQERFDRLQEVIGKRFDYTEMGKRTLGRHWKKLNDAQKTEFSGLFQKFLSKTYVGNVDGYAGEQVQYLKERRKGDFAEVQTKVVSSKLQIPLDYRLFKKSNEWHVYDVVIDGVSLVKNFRGQFDRIIKSSSYEGLFKKLRRKTQSTSPS